MWNVGHNVVWPVYLLSSLSVFFCAFGFWKRLLIYRAGKSPGRSDRFSERSKRLIAEVFGQKKVARVRDGGLFHTLFFWGFLILFIGTVIIMLQADFFTPFTGVNILSGWFYEVFSLVLDVAGLIALLMLGGLSYRRFIKKPTGLETTNQDYVIHFLLLVILITGFLIEGSRIAVTELRQDRGLAMFSPVGFVIAQAFSSFEMPSVMLLHKVFWWTHFALAIGFISVIPYTKLRHIITTSANAYLAPFEPIGSVNTINLENEEIEQFGAAKVADLSWKDILDADACTGCKRCQDRCPAAITGKPLSPMRLVRQVGETAEISPDCLLAETVGRESLWSCTMCGACQDICPANVEHLNKIIEMRRNLALMESVFPGEEVRTAVSNIEVNGNPFGLTFAGRGEWVNGLPVKLMATRVAIDILYFVGCYASFDKRNRQVARSFAEICAAAGVKVGILAKEEMCCGEPLRKLGNEYLYQIMARRNIELMRTYGVKKIVTTCPHCFNTLARDYKDLGLDLPVEHYSTFIARLVNEGRLALSPDQFEFTYHDSCSMARYMNIIDEPREILRVAGGNLKEMAMSGYDTFCCGGGGGRILAEENVGERICVRRVNMAKETGVNLLVSNCPFCLAMFEDGIRTTGLAGELVTKDLAEIIAERMVH